MDNTTSRYNYIYKDTESDKYSFFSVPFLLLNKEIYPGLSFEAAAVYGLLLDRMGLSSLNRDRFSDEQGRIYIYYKINDLAAKLKMSRSKAIRLLDQLEKTSLIERRKETGAGSMGSSNRIYLMDLSPGGTADDNYYHGVSADKASSIRIPFLMLSKKEFSVLTLEEIGLYSLLLNRMGLSLLNKDRFSDEQGRIYIRYSVAEIMDKMGVSKGKAVKMLKSLDDKEGIGLIHKEREAGYTNANRIYVKDFLSSILSFSSRARVGPPLLNRSYIKTLDGKIIRKSKIETYKYEEKEVTIKKLRKVLSKKSEEKASEPLKNQVVSNLDLQEFQNETFAVSDLNFQESQNKTFSSNKFEPMEVSDLNPNYFKDITKENYKKESNHIISNQINAITAEETGNDTDFLSLQSFKDKFSKNISLETITEIDEDLIEDPLHKRKAKEEVALIKEMYDKLIQEIASDKPGYRVGGVYFSKNDIMNQLLQIDAGMFLLAKDKVINSKKEIKHFGPYLISVLLETKSTYRMHVANMAATIK